MADENAPNKQTNPLEHPDDKPTVRIKLSDLRDRTNPVSTSGGLPPQNASDEPPAPDPVKPRTPEIHTCPSCNKEYRVGELVCTNCGFIFNAAGKTNKVEDTLPQEKRHYITGDALAERPITFEIENSEVRLPPLEKIVIGRGSEHPNDPSPDVDLTPFKAGELGVSRKHIRIRRNGTLLYVADLRSTNGTLLNGRKLIPEGERLLRSGDELRLGHLRIKVKF